jgi:hypothetical protein
LIEAIRQISHPPDRVFEFLSDLRNHWRLEERAFELDEVGESSGVIRLRGPLGISRKVVLLALGGYAWLRRLFERALANLEHAL